jgi:uncharacterized metal-binding protein YceD (DUF177 family)
MLSPVASALPRLVVRLQGTREAVPVEIAPDAAGRAAVAAELGLVAVRKLRLEGRLVPEGRADWRLDATLGASVVQDCVVTLAPVPSRIDEPVRRRYLQDLPEPGPGEVEMPDDEVEALPNALDLGAVMLEALALALPPYPRAPGAELGELVVTEDGAEPLTAEAARPFAGLRRALGQDEVQRSGGQTDRGQKDGDQKDGA